MDFHCMDSTVLKRCREWHLYLFSSSLSVNISTVHDSEGSVLLEGPEPPQTRRWRRSCSQTADHTLSLNTGRVVSQPVCVTLSPLREIWTMTAVWRVSPAQSFTKTRRDGGRGGKSPCWKFDGYCWSDASLGVGVVYLRWSPAKISSLVLF